MTKLIPPDLTQCQSEHIEGSAFALGHPRHWVRCKNKASYVVTENKPGDDGQIGSMSLCVECMPIMLKKCGTDYEVMIIK